MTDKPPLASRGRPRQFDPDTALAAALRIFWMRGYDGASLSELTAAMAITKPSLYSVFGNKEGLFRKALELYEREKLAYVGTALEEPTAKAVAREILCGALRLQLDSSLPKGCFGVISLMPCGADGDQLRAELIARRTTADDALVARFERARAEGDFAPGIEPRALARYLVAVVQGLSVQAASDANPDMLRRVVDMALSMWPGR